MQNEKAKSVHIAQARSAHVRTPAGRHLRSHAARRSHDMRAVSLVPARRGQVDYQPRHHSRASRLRAKDARLSESLRDWTLVVLMILSCLGLELFIAYLLKIGVL